MKRAIYLLIPIMFAFLFIGGPDFDSLRVTKLIWDTGHLLFFGILSIPIFHFLQRRSNFGLLTLIVCVGVISFLLGLAIEIVQHYIGRSFSLKDVLYDVLGAYLGLAIYALLFGGEQTTQAKAGLIAVALSISAYVLLPITFAVADQIKVESDFPVMADFESLFQLNRWEANLAVLKREVEVVRSGDASMSIEFSPGKYPRITLIDFHENWQEFNRLKLSIFNPSGVDAIVLKVFDRLHTSTFYKHNDRFNRKIKLTKGWNDIDIPLAMVESSPDNRAMNMSEIVSLSLFVIDLKKPLKLYLDDLYLAKEAPTLLMNNTP